MAKIIDLSKFREEEEPDIYTMDKQALLLYRDRLREKLRELDKLEPKNMMSEAYETWGDAHEELEDQLDEVLDLLDDME